MRQKRKPIPREKEKTMSIRSIAPGKLSLLIVVPSVCLRWPFYPHYSFQQIFYLVFLFYQFFFMFFFSPVFFNVFILQNSWVVPGLQISWLSTRQPKQPQKNKGIRLETLHEQVIQSGISSIFCSIPVTMFSGIVYTQKRQYQTRRILRPYRERERKVPPPSFCSNLERKKATTSRWSFR